MLFVPPGVVLLLEEFPVLPLKLGSLLPVAGPVATYSLLLVLLLEELPGVALPLVLPGVEEAVLFVLPGAELLEEVPELPPGVVAPDVVFDVVLFTFSAFPPLVVQAPLAAKV